MIRSIVNEANGPVALRVLTASRNPDSMLTSSLRGGWYWRVAKKATTPIPIEAPGVAMLGDAGGGTRPTKIAFGAPTGRCGVGPGSRSLPGR
jgi:hypothetical protein